MHWSDRVGRRLKSQELHIFLAVAEQASMGKAAEHLSMSRPVVSKAIASLERTVGLRLFDRTSSGVELTGYGKALQRRAVGLFDEFRSTMDELAFLADPNRGELRVGCTEVTAAGFVAALIAELARRYPGLSVHTVLGSVMQQHPPLRERRCEVFIARALIAVGPGSPWLKRRKTTLSDLANGRWIVSPAEALSGGLFPTVFASAGLKCPQPTILSDSLNLRNSLLQKDGSFVTIVPGSVLHFGPKFPSFKVLPIKLAPWRLPICIATLKGKTLSPAADLFVECARRLAKPLAKPP
jgi:DNA-binding transcriptional LysR family regulator